MFEGSKSEKPRKKLDFVHFHSNLEILNSSRNPVTWSGSATVTAALQVAIIVGFIYAHFSICFTS